MMRGLRSKEFDIAIVLAEGATRSILRGNPSKIVKTYVESPLVWGIHVAKTSEIESIAGIEGSRYAISRLGSGSHLMAIVDAAERGWETEQLDFEIVGNLDGARTALAEGQADTFFWERFTTAPFVTNGEFRRVGQRETLWPAFVICVHDDVLEVSASTVKRLLDAVNERCKQVMADPAACELIAERYELPSDQVEAWFAVTKWSTDYIKPAAALRTIKDYLLRLDLVTQAQVDTVPVWSDRCAEAPARRAID